MITTAPSPVAREATIPVVTRLQDNGDGGYTMYAFNNEEELTADFFEHEIEMGEEITDDMKREILDEHNPYENGYIGRDELKVRIHEDGSVSLAEPLSFHAGQ